MEYRPLTEAFFRPSPKLLFPALCPGKSYGRRYGSIMPTTDFRPFVPAPGTSRIAGPSARAHADAVTKVEAIIGLLAFWKKLFSAPFTGITVDGAAQPGLFTLREEDAPVENAARAANTLIGLLTDEERTRSCFGVESDQWRNWQNTEIYVETHGLRLEELATPTRDSVMALIKASLSARGYEKTWNTMRLNRVLGDLVGGPAVMNEWSYVFCLFGEPSSEAPWGWQLFGHHLALNCLFIGGQMVVSPIFLGAEPTFADDGPFKGLHDFQDEERKGLAFMQSLSDAQQSRALIANSMVGGDLPEGRRQFADGLHLGGAYQDNRIVPYEGLRGNEMEPGQQQALLDLTQEYLSILPDGPLAARMSDIESHFSDTHFCWIGNRVENKPFYYRIQSPVILVEFDHHAGVYLTNTEPANFHVHTLVRTPNGNDYGIDLIRQHYESAGHHKHSDHS